MIEKIGRECSGATPGLETKVTVLASAGINTDGEDKEADDGEDFDAREPKLEFAVEIDRQEVYESDDDPKDGDEDSN